MLLRLSLGIAILAGLAALYFSHFPVQERINNLTGELEQSRTNEQQAREAETKAKSEAKKAKEDLVVVSKDLADRTSDLEATRTRLTEQETRANKLSEDLTTVTGEKNTAQQEVAAWRATGVSIDQIKTQKAQLDRAASERDQFVAENKILARTNERLERELRRFVGEDVDPQMTPGLKGNVIAVDPRFDFVVLNVGGNQGVVENGKLLVNREGKLVAKLRITRVEPNRSIANVMEGEKYGDVMEGDQVIY